MSAVNRTPYWPNGLARSTLELPGALQVAGIDCLVPNRHNRNKDPIEGPFCKPALHSEADPGKGTRGQVFQINRPNPVLCQ